MPDTANLTPEQAYDVLVAQVHAPVFFNKLASVYNIVPQTPEEAREYLMLAGELRNVHEQETEKQATHSANTVNQARQDLHNMLPQYGYQSLNQPNVEQYKQAAKAAAQNPLLKQAAVTFSNFLAQAMNGQQA